MPVLNASVPSRTQPGAEELSRILKVEVPVIVKLAQRKIVVAEMLRIGLGSIIEFYRNSDEPLEMMINNRPIAMGVAVKVGENFGIKLTQVGDPKVLIGAMGAK